MNLVEKTSVILAQTDETRIAPLACPTPQSPFDQPGTICVEIVDTCDIDRDAARRDPARRGIDLGFNCACILGGPGPGGAEFDRIAARLATEQNPCRHCATPSLNQRRAPTLDPRQAASRNRTGYVCGGTPSCATSQMASVRGASRSRSRAIDRPAPVSKG